MNRIDPASEALGLHRQFLTRRWFLQQCGVGLGAMALRHLMGGTAQASNPTAGNAGAQAHSPGAFNPLAPRAPHFAPRAKRVIFLFQAGAPSHLELFDHKPELARWNGKLPPPSLLEGYRAAFINPSSTLLGPKFKFTRHGRSGIELSELLPHLGTVADELCIVKSLHTDAFNHAPAQIFMSTGSQQFGRPSLGAWSTYGLGSECNDLPAYVVFSTGSKGPSGGSSNWGSGFLPTPYGGTLFRTGAEPVLFLGNPKGIDPALQRDSLDVIQRLNARRLGAMGDPEIAARISAYEMAYKMQSSAPDLMDLSRESKATLEAYGAEPGKPTFANACLLARRLVERGVRFVQVFHEAWDQHGSLVADLKRNCANTDRPTAALIRDLRQRGLLDDTLVVWGGEFGRTPFIQGNINDRPRWGRDHHPYAYTTWIAGGGIRPGISHGETDDLGMNVVADGVHVHDLQATLLHLLGIDHERLTYRFQGRDFRLTDVHGHVVKPILA